MPENAPRPLHFAAFVMNTTGHIIQGTWRRPTAKQADFNSLDHWVDLAKTLERGKFDAIFFADVVGLYADYRGDDRKYFEAGLQVPSNDPSVLASAIAYATEHLGIAFTASILQEHPFNFARRISHPRPRQQGPGRLEHRHQLPAQRLAQLRPRGPDQARRALRLGRRVRRRDLQAVGGLLGGGRAASRTAETGIHADYDKVHKINHEGPRYRVEGPHLVTPSPAAHAAALPGRRLRGGPRRSRPRTPRPSSSSRPTSTPPPATPATSAPAPSSTVDGPRTSSSSRACTSSPGRPRRRRSASPPSSTSGSTTTRSSRTCPARSASTSATRTSTSRSAS